MGDVCFSGANQASKHEIPIDILGLSGGIYVLITISFSYLIERDQQKLFVVVLWFGLSSRRCKLSIDWPYRSNDIVDKTKIKFQIYSISVCIDLFIIKCSKMREDLRV